MNKYLSDKLTILYTLLIIMVVYIHSYYLEAEQYPCALFLQNLTGRGICRVANPLFFCISGYLFARNINCMKDVFSKQRKRIRTLLIPYILWNIIFVLWYVLLECFPGINRFNNSKGLLDNYLNVPLSESLYNLLVVPAAFQLWFLRDLLMMLLFSPLLWWITNKSVRGVLAMILLSIIVYPMWLIYFWIGVTIAVKKCNIENYYRPVWFVLLCIMTYIGNAIYIAYGNSFNSSIDVLVNIIGVYLVWCLYDVLSKGKSYTDKGIWKYVCGYSFFIYCFHEPAFNIIKKMALYLFGTTESTIIFFYYLNPWIMLVSAILIARFLQKIAPQLYNILTGGR